MAILRKKLQLDDVKMPDDIGQKKSLYFVKQRLDFEEKNNIVKKDGNDEEAARRMIENKKMQE